MGCIILEVLLSFFLIVAHIRRPPIGFLLQLEEGVDLLGEEGRPGTRKMPYLVDFYNVIALG